MRKTILAAALAAANSLGFVAAPITGASAQSYPSYCANQLRATSFYRNIRTQNGTTTYTFYMILQNTGRSISFAPAVGDGRLSSRPTGNSFTTIAQNATLLVNLGLQTATNTSGVGILNSNDVIPAVRVTCR